MEEKKALATEYGFDIDNLEFSVEELSLDELREKFESMKADKAVDTGAHKVTDDKEDFALEGEFRSELCNALEKIVVETCWGLEPKYWMWDYDKELSEVYATDIEDWNIYGFPYSMDGDHVVIDFDRKRRMKIALEPFDEGSQTCPMAGMFTKVAEKYTTNDAQWSEKYQSASAEISEMKAELNTLRQFKADTEEAYALEQRNEIFAQFEDLTGVDAFEELKKNCAEYELDALEEKCYAIRGKNTQTAKFSVETPKAPKLMVEKGKPSDEPYGGVFEEFGIGIEKNNE